MPASADLRRLPRPARKPRSPAFFDRFEDRALVYDCFWHADGERVLLVGPPPMNLKSHYRAARYHAMPSRTALVARDHVSLSTMITELGPAPTGTTAITMQLGGARYDLPIEPNQSEAFAGRRVLFTMSKDNDLGWIAEWARWHVQLHGTDAIVLFDNGSSRYDTAEIEETLLAIPGLDRIAVLDWPGRFGMTDPALAINPYWAHFLQITSMTVALRRFAAAASGLLNCDIDELAATHSGRSIYAHLADARRGLVVFRGQWIEADRAGGRHRDYTMCHRDPRAARSDPKKWVLDPGRDWVRRLDVYPYWHWIAGRPVFGKTMPDDAFYRHFKAINTNWKEARTDAVKGVELTVDEALVNDFARLT